MVPYFSTLGKVFIIAFLTGKFPFLALLDSILRHPVINQWIAFKFTKLNGTPTKSDLSTP